jgi:hypothetical protein
LGLVGARHFGEKCSNLGRHLENEPKKECALENREKQCRGSRKVKGRKKDMD